MQKWCLFLFHKILITPLHWPNCAWHKWDSSPLDLFIFNDFAFKINLQKGQSWVTKVSVIRSFWSHFFCYGKPWMEKKIHVQMWKLFAVLIPSGSVYLLPLLWKFKWRNVFHIKCETKKYLQIGNFALSNLAIIQKEITSA